MTREHIRTRIRKFAFIFAAGVAAFSFPAGAQDSSVSGGRSNVSNTPAAKSAKSKLGLVTQYTAARKADGTAIKPIKVGGKSVCRLTTESGAVYDVGVVRLNKDGKEVCQVQPQVVAYTDRNPATNASDTFAAVSLDDGHTWRRMNLSKSATKLVNLTSDDGVTLTNPYGDTARPALAVAGRNIFVAWSSKFCPNGNPSGFPVAEGFEDLVGDGQPNNSEVEMYPDDLHQVTGPQGYVDYGAEYGRPDLGVRALSCVVAARGTVDSYGNIIWSKDEQITTGRRDAYQVTTAVAGEAGFAIVWQEDPVGLDPGKTAGPGDGMSGAIANHQTDIWYTFIKWGDFLKGLPKYDAFQPIDPADGVARDSSEENTIGDGVPASDNRAVASVRMSPAVRLTDNASCRVGPDFEEDGVTLRRHGPAFCKLPQYCASLTAPNDDGKRFCVTEEGSVLDGDTSSTRPNLFLQKVTDRKTGEVIGAEAILGYEESKGLGYTLQRSNYDEVGELVPKEDPEDLGKNVVYHHLPDFSKPATIQPGYVLNAPELDAAGNVLYASDGVTPLTKNARRIRFIIQPKDNKGDSGTVMVALWKEGAEGKGRPSDIMMRRWVDGYAVTNLVCDNVQRSLPAAANSNPTLPAGAADRLRPQCTAINVSASTPVDVTYDTSGGNPKVESWSWDQKNLMDGTEDNPYEDARAHRGILRGDFLAIGYIWTPNWTASRNGNDVYDFYIRRSFDGGRQMSNMHGQFEQPKNISRLRGTHSNSINALEPRIVGTPSSIKTRDPVTGLQVPTGVADDVQNPMVFYTSYGTSTNPDTNLGGDVGGDVGTPTTNDGIPDLDGGTQDGIPDLIHADQPGDCYDDDVVYVGDDDWGDEEAATRAEPLDIFYSWTDDFGETYKEVLQYRGGTDEWVLEFDWLAKNAEVHEGEAQLRLNPAGTKLDAIWNAETAAGSTEGACVPGQEPGSDICHRRVGGQNPLGKYDVNADGALSLADWRLVEQAFEVSKTVSGFDLGFDFNGDGEVSRDEDGTLWISACRVYVNQNPAVKLECPKDKPKFRVVADGGSAD